MSAPDRHVVSRTEEPAQSTCRARWIPVPDLPSVRSIARAAGEAAQKPVLETTPGSRPSSSIGAKGEPGDLGRRQTSTSPVRQWGRTAPGAVGALDGPRGTARDVDIRCVPRRTFSLPGTHRPGGCRIPERGVCRRGHRPWTAGSQGRPAWYRLMMRLKYATRSRWRSWSGRARRLVCSMRSRAWS